MIIGFTSSLTVASSILQMKSSMHGYMKINDGPFLFCEGTHQSVLGPLLLLLDHGQIVTQGTKGDLDFVKTQANFFPWVYSTV